MNHDAARRRVLWGAVGALALLAGPFPHGAVAQTAAPPVATGTARIWFYRDYEPSVSLNMAPIALNGTIIGYLPPDGSAFYRDVAPGHYRISAPSQGMDVNQTQDVDLAPGQEIYAKILASNSWEEGGDIASYRRDTFYVRLMPPQIARGELPAHPLIGG